jgi:hypothetical protein
LIAYCVQNLLDGYPNHIIGDNHPAFLSGRPILLLSPLKTSASVEENKFIRSRKVGVHEEIFSYW